MDVSESWVVRIVLLHPINFRCYDTLVKASYDHVLPPYFMSFPQLPAEAALSVFESVRKMARSDCQLRHVCLSVRPHGTGLPMDRSSWNLVFEFFLGGGRGGSVKKIQVSLQPYNNKECFTCRPIHIFCYISLISSQNKKFRQKLQRKSKPTFCVQQIPPPPKIMPFMR